eukprot:EG_transcript_30157
MLQRAPDLAADLIKAQQASPYVQPSQFSFALGMPKATIVRNAAAILAVLEPPDEPHSLLWSIVREVFDLKDAIQMALQEVVGPALRSTYTSDRGLTFSVEYIHDAANEGVVELFRVLPAAVFPGAKLALNVEDVSISAMKNAFSTIRLCEFRPGLCNESFL